MIKEKRKSSRRSMRYTAWVVLGDNLHGCALSDISQSGAKLDVEKSEKLPDRFVLLLSASGKPRRACRVVWRTANQIGVEFERQLTGPLPGTHTSSEAATPEPAASDA